MNKKNLLHIYGLLVCFVTTLVLIVCLSISLNLTTNLAVPQWKYFSQLLRYSTNEKYINYLEMESLRGYYQPEFSKGARGESKELENIKKLTPSQLEEKKLEARKQFLEDMRGDDFAQLITSLQWAFIAMLFFLIHWRIYKNSKE